MITSKKHFLVFADVEVGCWMSGHSWMTFVFECDLRYLGRSLGPWDHWTLQTLDLGTLGPLPSSNTSSYFAIHPLTSFCLFLLLSSFGMVWLWGGGGLWVVTLEDEIGDRPLTFILILKVVGWVEPWDLLLPSKFSSSNLLPTPYSSQLTHPPPKPPPNSS